MNKHTENTTAGQTSIQANRLDRAFFKYQDEFESKALSVLRSGHYILGSELESFEHEFAAYLGAKECVGVGNGLDALWIAFRILGIGKGDEVLVQGNTYIASVMGITINGATPVFIEPDEYYNIDASKLEEKITPRTKAILVVHLYGQASNMGPVMDIAKKHSLRVVEDCAQSHGAKFDGVMTGTFGDIGCFSFYPSKNLGAFGDGGAIVTNDANLARAARIFRNYGSEKRYHNMVVGANSRLDEMQAGLLSVRLKHLDDMSAEKAELAGRYTAELDKEKYILPEIRQGATHIWHQYVVRLRQDAADSKKALNPRDRLKEYLHENGIETIIHYPIPPHLSEAYKYLNVPRGSLPITENYADNVLSIPLYNGMAADEQAYVIEKMNGYA